MTPRGYPNFNSYVKNLRVLVFRTDRQMDRQTDRQTEKLIRCGLGNLSVPPGKNGCRRYVQPVLIICQGIPGRHLPCFYILPFFILLCPAILGFSFCALREKASVA
jgi:hypothetical protein